MPQLYPGSIGHDYAADLRRVLPTGHPNGFGVTIRASAAMVTFAAHRAVSVNRSQPLTTRHVQPGLPMNFVTAMPRAQPQSDIQKRPPGAPSRGLCETTVNS